MPTVAACQFEVTALDPAANADAVVERIEALDADVELAVFPEYALTGFIADGRVKASALSSDGPLLDAVAEAAQREDTAIAIGYLEQDEDSLYNALAYLDSEGGRTVYRKRHLWGGESEYVTPGDDRVIVETPLGTTGLVTCYDLNFVAESAAFTDTPVDALLVAGAWPGEYAANWDLLLRARALDGVRWVVGAGRTGVQDIPGTDRTVYAGRSAIIRPDGSVDGRLYRKNRSLVRDIDPGELAVHREFIGSVDS